MKIRLGRTGALLLVTLLVMALSGCERERPAPRAAATPLAGASRTPAGQPKAGGATPAAGTSAVPGTAAPGAVVATPGFAPGGAVVAPSATPVSQPAAPGGVTEGPVGMATYTVKSGDTLAAIAARYGTTAVELMTLNSLADPNQLSVGQTLRVPALPGGAPAAPPVSAPVVPQPANTQAPAPATGVYTVKSGETLAQIAARFNTSAAELQRLNNLSDPNQIYAGQSLKVPAVAPQSRTHTVASGDTLGSIALRYGVTVAAIQVANNVADPDQIRVGQVLKIP